MKESIYTNDGEITMIDGLNFIKRQHKTMITVFAIAAISVFSYAISRPILYQSKASIAIGERLYFSQQQQIESADEIKYRYSALATIRPIKNTRIIEITTTSDKRNLAEENLNVAVQKIILSHNSIANEKKVEFERLLNLLTSNSLNKSELIKLLDNASNSSLSKKIGEYSTKEIPGKFAITMSTGIFAALLLTFILALAKDRIERSRPN